MVLFDQTTPPDTEAFNNGAQRIRETKATLEALLTQIFNDDSTNTFLTGWVQTAMIANAAIGTAQIQAGAITSSLLASQSVNTANLNPFIVLPPGSGSS